MKPPSIESLGVGDYLCVHNVLQANAAVYRLYKEKYFKKQRGKVGICLNSVFAWPLNKTDAIAAERAMQFDLGKYANPIFGEIGGYPQVMIDILGNKSKAEGQPWSRLPTMTPAVRYYIKGTADFLALNYYTSVLVSDRIDDGSGPSWFTDLNVNYHIDPSWKQAKSDWLRSAPQGLHDLLVWIKDRYKNPTVMITENGWSDDGQLEDDGRVEYLKVHLAAVSRAINEKKCNVIAYTVWSLTDNFEWKLGYTERFGIHYIDFNSTDKTRVPKKSAKFFKKFMKTKSFEL